MTPILLILVRTCVSYELVQVLEKLSTTSHNAFVCLLLLVTFQMGFELWVLVIVLMTIRTLVAGADDGLGPIKSHPQLDIF